MSDFDKPASKLHGLFIGLSWLLFLLLASATALVVLNWLDDFLHAPIGIKDYPPEPGMIVQLANLAWLPLLVILLIFALLSFMSSFAKTIPLLLGTSLVSCGVLSLIGGILGELKSTELFAGEQFFVRDVTPALWCGVIVSFLGLSLYGGIQDWKKEIQLKKRKRAQAKEMTSIKIIQR
jgi:hypothetical protein